MPKAIKRDELVAYLDDYLRVADIPDSSPNGLQVQGSDTVERVAWAVDASVQTIAAAVRADADMLIVHHGLWWGHHEQIVGNMYRRVAGLIRNDLSLYTVHIPLDCHPEVGNNVELARLLDLSVERPWGDYKGVDVGVIATVKRPLARATFASSVARVLKAKPDVLAFGPPRIKRIAIVSGGGAMMAETAARDGCDTLFTGESAHSAYHMAREAEINVVYGGHYATETVGLRALDRHLRKRFPIRSKFVSAPTGY